MYLLIVHDLIRYGRHNEIAVLSSLSLIEHKERIRASMRLLRVGSPLHTGDRAIGGGIFPFGMRDESGPVYTHHETR